MAAADYAEDDDALFVLTAAMLTPGRFPGVLGDDYPAACAHLGLDPLAEGYGLVFGQDGSGARWTVATTDTAMVACALAAWDCGLEYELSPDGDSLAASLPGWPLPVAVSVPGIPAPHDPADEEGAGPALAPPDTSQWGPRQRRLGADEIAAHWHEWRDQLAPDGTEPVVSSEPAGTAGPIAPAELRGTTDPVTSSEPPRTAEPVVLAEPAGQPRPGPDAPEAEPVDARQDRAREPAAVPPPAVSHDGVRRALQSAEEYVRTPPPPGRVRTTAGTLRADGPGWSLVARADDIAFVLLDDAPGEVLPVGRGAALPPLLAALGKLAATTA